MFNNKEKFILPSPCEHSPNIKGFKFTIISIQWYDFEEAIIQPEANHSALWIYDPNDASLWGAAYAILLKYKIQLNHNYTAAY